MDQKVNPRQKKALLIKLAVIAVLGLGAALFFLRGLDLPHVIDTVLGWFRSIGPIPFFAAMAILPAFGFPVLAFSLTAGPVFGPQIGLGWVVAGVIISLGVNITLTYWLARYALRPLVEGIVRKLGYGLPQVQKDDHLGLALLLRIMPGPPFFAQSYLLGLAEVPFFTYLWVSWLVSSTYSVSLVIFGDSVMKGDGKKVFFAVSIFVVAVIAIKMVRRHLTRKAVAASESLPKNGS
jgi:uncharacterized membrane protein YdjX (TVP38/TMEM64 family)